MLLVCLCVIMSFCVYSFFSFGPPWCGPLFLLLLYHSCAYQWFDHCCISIFIICSYAYTIYHIWYCIWFIVYIVLYLSLREFTKGGLVKEGLAIRHVFNYNCTREAHTLLSPPLLNPPLCELPMQQYICVVLIVYCCFGPPRRRPASKNIIFMYYISNSIIYWLLVMV